MSCPEGWLSARVVVFVVPAVVSEWCGVGCTGLGRRLMGSLLTPYRMSCHWMKVPLIKYNRSSSNGCTGAYSNV